MTLLFFYSYEIFIKGSSKLLPIFKVPELGPRVHISLVRMRRGRKEKKKLSNQTELPKNLNSLDTE